MRRSYAFLAGLLAPLALGATLALGGCTPTSLVAQPDIVMKSAVPPATLAPCIAQDLGRQMRDIRPKLVYYRGIHEISVNSPRGDLLAFLTVEQDWANGSIVSFYNGDLYWPDRTTSGMFPDVARDNWHRAENAVLACQPQAATSPAVKTGAIMPPPPAVPVSQVGNGAGLRPLTAKPLAPLQLGPQNPTP
ncbi:MAG TPA: hypothetical protein VG742_16805 [Dongiaceae bacterium]|nr:hypothetical protein [Dongiaceae bacterium]